MNPEDLSDDELLYIVGTTDKRLFEEGMDIRERSWKVVEEVMSSFGYVRYRSNLLGEPGLVDRVEKAFSSIYRKHDLVPGGHIGVFMYRDIFARISVPIIYGRVRINPFDFVELTNVQLRMINLEPDQIAVFVNQFCDVADIQNGISRVHSLSRTEELASRYLEFSRFHLHAAAAILTGGYDYRGAVQSSILASELALKAALAAKGHTDRTLKRNFGHCVTKMAEEVANYHPEFDINRVDAVLRDQPHYTDSRYSAEQPGRLEAGHLAMGSQFLVSEIMRLFGVDSFWNIFGDVGRVYPSLMGNCAEAT